MLESYDTVAANVLTQLRYAKNCYRVFGSRYCNDRRYRIKVLSCYGNCTIDTFHISVGGYNYIVKVYRILYPYNSTYHDSYYEIGYYEGSDFIVLWDGGIYE